MQNMTSNNEQRSTQSVHVSSRMVARPWSVTGVWIPDAAVIEAERLRREEQDRRERPFLEVPRHPVMEERPSDPEPASDRGVLILEI